MSDRRTPVRRRRAFDAVATPAQAGGDLRRGLLVLAALALVAVLSTLAIDGSPFGRGYQVEVQVPAGAPALKDGDVVRIAGTRAGQVRAVEPGRGGGALLTLELDGGPVGRDARAAVRLRGLAGAVTVDLDPGDAVLPIPSGGRLAGVASAGTALTDVVEAFGPRTRGAARAALRGFGSGLAGRGDDLGRAVDDLGPVARDGQVLLAALRPRPGALSGLSRALDGTLRAVGAAPLDDALRGAARTLAAIGPREAGATVGALPDAERAAARTLPPTRALLADAGAALDHLRPATARLAAALPPLNRALARDGGLGELSRLAATARPVLGRARPLARALDVPGRLVAPLVDPVQRIAAHLVPYEEELFLAPDGFTRWGGFRFGDGQAKGARAVRFSMVLTCARARDGYPAPGAAIGQEQACR